MNEQKRTKDGRYSFGTACEICKKPTGENYFTPTKADFLVLCKACFYKVEPAAL